AAGPAEDGSAAAARLWIDAAEVAGAVAQQGAAGPAEVAQHQLARLAGGDVGERLGVDHLGEVVGLQQVQTAGVVDTFDPARADFRHAAVVDDARPPAGLDA